MPPGGNGENSSTLNINESDLQRYKTHLKELRVGGDLDEVLIVTEEPVLSVEDLDLVGEMLEIGVSYTIKCDYVAPLGLYQWRIRCVEDSGNV